LGHGTAAAVGKSKGTQIGAILVFEHKDSPEEKV
jgi:hypothetical protein